MFLILEVNIVVVLPSSQSYLNKQLAIVYFLTRHNQLLEINIRFEKKNVYDQFGNQQRLDKEFMGTNKSELDVEDQTVHLKQLLAEKVHKLLFVLIHIIKHQTTIKY